MQPIPKTVATRGTGELGQIRSVSGTPEVPGLGPEVPVLFWTNFRSLHTKFQKHHEGESDVGRKFHPTGSRPEVPVLEKPP